MDESQRLPSRRIMAVYAEDWSIEDGPMDIDHAFKLYHAWVVGFLVRETEESITLAPEVFDDKIRHAQTIPKTAIKFSLVLREKE